MKIKLQTKAVVAILIMAFILCGVAIFVSYNVHAKTMDRHYKQLAGNIAQTAAVTCNKEVVKKYTDAVKEIYLKNPMPELGQGEEEAYFKQYEGIMDEEYKMLFNKLNDIKKSNVVKSLYVIYVDAESKSCVYIIDADNTENTCPMGTWDIIYEENYNVLTHPENGFDSYITNTEEYGWLCSAGAAIMDDNGQVIAHAMVDLSMDEVMNERYAFRRNLCMAMFVITMVILAIFLLIIKHSVIKPINVLSDAARGFVDSMNNSSDSDKSFFSEIKIKSRDEIEQLHTSFKFMEKELYDYIDNLSRITSEKERIGAELSIATKIQADMLPSIFPEFSECNEFNIYATMHPAKEVGGDFYDFFMVDETHLAIVVADVSGKGIPAALFMVIGKTLIKDHTQTGSDLSKVFEKVNNLLCESNSEGLFITAFEGVLDLVTGEFVYVNAGHECPYIYRKGGQYTLHSLEPGFVLAGMEDMMYDTGFIKLEPGDRIFQFTDGVTEAINVNEELYGDKRLEEVLNRNADKKPADLLQAVRMDIENFVGEADQFDDITMLCVEYRGRGQA